MVMVAVRAKGVLWGADASLFDLLAVGDMHRGPTTVDVTLYLRGNAKETSPTSSHHQSHDVCMHPLRQLRARKWVRGGRLEILVSRAGGVGLFGRGRRPRRRHMSRNGRREREGVVFSEKKTACRPSQAGRAAVLGL